MSRLIYHANEDKKSLGFKWDVSQIFSTNCDDVHLDTSSKFTGTPLKYILKQVIQIKLNNVKNHNWQDAD